MKRVVKPELLDELPPDDASAANSRRDLRRLNWLMGHARVLGDLLISAVGPHKPARIVELGAGDGWLMLQVARRLASRWPRLEIVLVDKSDVVTEEIRQGFSMLGWRLTTVEADVFEWLNSSSEPMNAIVTNLFLHHFARDRLTELLRLAAKRTAIFAATEPRRAAVPLAFSRLAGCIGCNAITRHDIVVSVRAGFVRRELSEMWPVHSQWRLRERSAGPFSHVFLAERQSST